MHGIVCTYMIKIHVCTCLTFKLLLVCTIEVCTYVNISKLADECLVNYKQVLCFSLSQKEI